MKTMVTSTDLAEILNSISRYIKEELQVNRNYVEDVLMEMVKVEWRPEIARKYGSDLREIVTVIRDYNTGDFQGIEVKELCNLMTMLMFYTEPVYMHEKAGKANTLKIQNNIACRLIGYYRQLDIGYIEHLTAKNTLFDDVLIPKEKLNWDTFDRNQSYGKEFEIEQENMGSVLVNDEERQLEEELAIGRIKGNEEMVLSEGEWATGDGSWF